MLTIAILVAQGRSEELRAHVKGAIANGVTKDEIREVLLHAAVYCGVPPAVNGYRNAAQALEEVGLA
jgi:4-carboxymuconolactone decarboxylase